MVTIFTFDYENKFTLISPTFKFEENKVWSLTLDWEDLTHVKI